MGIRLYRDEDKIPVQKLVKEVLAEFGWSPSLKYDYDLDDPEKFYSGKLDRFFVLEEAGKLIGTIAVKDHKKGSAELRKLFLRKEYRGRGLGERLIDYLLGYCRKQKFSEIKVLTDPSLIPAISLYKKKGFIVTETTSTGDIVLNLRLN